MNPYYQDDWVTIYHGDSREVLPSLPKASAIVTDPPYGLGFMGREWDTFDKSQFGRKGMEGKNDLKVKKNFNILPRYQVGGLYEFMLEWAEIAKKSCLPGSPLLSFGGTRTFHRMACAIEDAGWEIRDTLGWIYGSGFPKSLDIGKAVDKVLGNKREVVGANPNVRPNCNPEDNTLYQYGSTGKTEPITKGNSVWEGYRTSLKPAYEPIILAMSPLDGTFAHNALTHGVAGLNIGECRIGTDKVTIHGQGEDNMFHGGFSGNIGNTERVGRFPPNLILDDSPEVAGIFPESKSSPFKSATTKGHHSIHGNGEFDYTGGGYTDNGSATRFFYCAKASKAERDRGCESLETRQPDPSRKEGNPGGDNPRNRGVHKVHNDHPTIKPLALMTYLVKLVKMPEYNLVVDPFCGTGTTLMACIRLGIPCIGVDNDEHTCEIAALRCVREAEVCGFYRKE